MTKEQKAVCPECRDGKHGNCIGYTMHEPTDTVVVCQCPHSER